MQLMYPWFLLVLLVITIPIVIHLLQLRKPQRILFTNTSFINEVELVTVRHRKIQYLLVLIARVLAIVCLVLIFCQPYIPVKDGLGKSNLNSVNVLLDNTFSMQQQGGTQRSLFAEVVEEASVLGKTAASGGRFRLINKGGGQMTQVAYQNKLDGMKLSPRDFFSKLNLVNKNEDDNSSELYIFSDFQKNTFGSPDLHKMGVTGGSRKVVLVPVVGKESANVYVDSVWLDDAFVRVRTNVGLHVRLRNGGSLAAKDCPVKVFLNARQVAAFRVTIDKRQAVTSVVQVQVVDNKLALGRVVTEDAPVTFDNIYYFTLQPAAAIKVLEIGAEPVVKQLYGNEPLFDYSFTKPQSIDYGVLRRADMVLVRELPTLDAGLREGLRALVKRGGSVVVVPSGLTAGRESYQLLFRELGIGAVQWEAATVVPELREVAMPNVQEPFFRDVFGVQQRAVTMPRAAPVLRWARTGTDIMRLRDGESYLADFTSGAGRVYVFSAPFAEEYSDFAAHALFVPVMYRLAMLSYRNEQLPAYRLTQAGLNLQLPAGGALAGTSARADEAGFRLVKDSLALIPTQRVLGQEVRLDMPIGMDAPGFYQVQRGGKVLTTLAFNQDKRESELAAYSAEELRQLIGPNQPNVRVLEGGADGLGVAKFRAEQTGQPLWRYFLVLALMCLLAEALLIRFGNRRVRVNPRQVAA